MGDLVYLTQVEGVPDSKNPEFIYITDKNGSFILSVDKSLLEGLADEALAGVEKEEEESEGEEGEEEEGEEEEEEQAEIGGTFDVAINVLDQEGTLLKKIQIQVILTSEEIAKSIEKDTSESDTEAEAEREESIELDEEEIEATEADEEEANKDEEEDEDDEDEVVISVEQV